MMNIIVLGRRSAARASCLTLCGVMVLAGCGEGRQVNLFEKRFDVVSEVRPNTRSGQLVERDVEAPNIFQVTELGLWDGRPSLGGVWVAHPDVIEPERVIIRGTQDGQFVIGALFRRERENPGPPVQVSSDAAAALGMLAGAPMELNITALRREEIPAEGEPSQADGVETLDAPEQVLQTDLVPSGDESGFNLQAPVAESVPAS